ncbi:MAG: FAD-dependent oxidoreductase [Myxococcota bacterium]
MEPTLTVVGAGYAGLMALGRLRMHCPDAHIRVVEPRTRFVERIHLHEVAAGVPPRELALAELFESLSVEHVPRRVARVRGTTVTLDDGSELASDGLILALGSRTRPPPGPAHVLDDVETARALFEALKAAPEARVTIVGSGTTALEVATELAVRFPDARLRLWRAEPTWPWSERAGRSVDARLASLGIAVIDGGRVLGLDAGAAWSASHREEHDLAVWCAGFEPAPVDLPGVRTRDGRLAVDPFLALSEGVFAAGDLCVPPQEHRAGCVTALPTGAHAAANLAAWVEGRPLEPFAFRDLIACVALGGNHGLLQPLAADGPMTQVLGGLPGGAVKRGILQYVRAILALERALGRPVYRWPRSARALEAVEGAA